MTHVLTRGRRFTRAAVALACATLPFACRQAQRTETPADHAPSATGEGRTTPRPAGAVAAPITFEERARESGIDFRMQFLPGEQGEHFKINLYDHGSGVTVADYDRDGDDDILLLNQLGPNALYRNDGSGHFTDVTAEAGGLGLAERICVAAAFADYDADGDEDLYVTTTRGGNVLFRNDGKGHFEDVTKAAGLTLTAHSQSPVFFDADGDGDLDLLVTNTARWTLEELGPEGTYHVGPANLLDLLDSPHEANNFYRNDGDGTFTDATAESGLAGPGWAGDTAVFDFDEDGDLDVFVGNMFGASILYRNDGKGRFEDATQAALGRISFGTVGCKPLDFDGDGHLDLFVVDMHSDMWMAGDSDPKAIEEGRKYAGFFGKLLETEPRFREAERVAADRLGLRYDHVLFGNTLYRNLGGGRFEEVSDRAKAETFWPWGIATGDFDADGDEDAFVPTGMGYPYFYWPNRLLVNRGDGTFGEGAAAAGLDPPPGGTELDLKWGGRAATRSSRAAATGDFDGDGRVDLVVNNFNDRAFLYLNRTPGGHHVGFRLRATHGDPSAVGALVRLSAGGRTQVRQVPAFGGYLAQSSRTVRFGVGSSTRVDRVEIHWPDGAVQVLGGQAGVDRVEVSAPDGTMQYSEGLDVDRVHDVSATPR